MDNNLWELLNNDDSDLSSFVCPTNHSSSNSTRLFPGLIGVVQVAIMNRQSRESLSTQEFIMRTHQVVQHEFNINPWLYALVFVRSQGFVDYIFYCVPLTIIIVKSCTLDDFGDMRITLKDPTETIDVTMKQTIIEGQNYSSYMTNIHVDFVLAVVFFLLSLSL
ncbi:hypothetical protein HKD37_03G006600 [Glycine soja]